MWGWDGRVASRADTLQADVDDTLSLQDPNAFPVPTFQDLAGFWDLLQLSIEDVSMKFAELQQLKANGWKIVEPKVRAGLCCWHLSPVTSPSLLPKHICAQTAATRLLLVTAFSKHLKNKDLGKMRLKKGLFPRRSLAAGSLGVPQQRCPQMARQGLSRGRDSTPPVPSCLCRWTKGCSALPCDSARCRRGVGLSRRGFGFATCGSAVHGGACVLHASWLCRARWDARSLEVLAPHPP